VHVVRREVPMVVSDQLRRSDPLMDNSLVVFVCPSRLDHPLPVRHHPLRRPKMTSMPTVNEPRRSGPHRPYQANMKLEARIRPWSRTSS